MAGELLLINPRKRRTKKAASGAVRRKKTHAKASSYHTNPAPRRRRRRLSAVHSKMKSVRRRYRRNPIKFSVNSITGMAKAAAIGAAGAIAVDVTFGYVAGMLPASAQSPIDTAGGINPMYYAAKGGLAIALGVFGSKVTKQAGNLAAGSLTISMYEIMRSLIPASVQLGNYVSPAPLAARRMRPMQTMPQPQKMNKFVSGMGAGYTPPVDRKYMGEYVS